MEKQQPLHILKQGADIWNQWRQENPDIWLDFSEADLSKARLQKADLHSVNFRGTSLRGAILRNANLEGADLRGANLNRSDLTNANLMYSMLVETNLKEADLTNCSIYGISVWNVQLERAIQSNLIITPPHESVITVDNLEVAQIIYLLLNNTKVRDIINAFTSKVVLILGGFTEERKLVLDALRDELRTHNYLPVVFDFEKPSSRNFTESIIALASLARFIIADITAPSSLIRELSVIASTLPVTIQPLLEKSENEYGMISHFKRYPWILPVYRYKDLEDLLSSLGENVIAPAEKKASELEKIKQKDSRRYKLEKTL